MNSSAPTPLTDDAFQPVTVSIRIRRPWWLRVLVLFGGMTLLLFGGCVIFSFFCRVERHETPASVLAAGGEITDFQLPPGYTGKVAEVVETPMFTVRNAIFQHESGKGVLSIAAMDVHWQWLASNDEGLRAGLDRLAGEMRVIVGETSTQTIEIRGQPVDFQIRAGQDALSSTKLHEVRGLFGAKSGVAEVRWQAEDAIWTADSQEQFLKSLAD